MNIPEAFDGSNQQKAHVELDQEEFEELTTYLRAELEEFVDGLNQSNINEDQVHTALLAEALNLAIKTFVAGRCYEEQYSVSSDTFPVDLPKDVLSDVITILVRRRA